MPPAAPPTDAGGVVAVVGAGELEMGVELGAGATVEVGAGAAERVGAVAGAGGVDEGAGAVEDDDAGADDAEAGADDGEEGPAIFPASVGTSTGLGRAATDGKAVALRSGVAGLPGVFGAEAAAVCVGVPLDVAVGVADTADLACPAL
ncbi:hypothetical protein [Arthrobacter sp. ISL-30]|uniref:hypothetical protein n=1 Tax=Arthrobacter sp. ISL-30 TaxID=2819109 RepID=UPI001BE99E9D|nr:hypothetical protein [Arthrobacter sp. ISL-30]MBT2513299.1 hypothetical protein [Arthrobacter sp. ISL-30]